MDYSEYIDKQNKIEEASEEVFNKTLKANNATWLKWVDFINNGNKIQIDTLKDFFKDAFSYGFEYGAGFTELIDIVEE